MKTLSDCYFNGGWLVMAIIVGLISGLTSKSPKGAFMLMIGVGLIMLVFR